ncbi:MAG: hypothetical protein A4E20_10990 [Nitrospira sp. SG-bin2]|nr:MAG: hypothetical protein A4E20_10990 [Nitrospira sp. SG-bin2]
MTPEEFAAKVQSEGGICDAFFEYGLNEDDLDDSDPLLKHLVRQFIRVSEHLYAGLESALARYTD